MLSLNIQNQDYEFAVETSKYLFDLLLLCDYRTNIFLNLCFLSSEVNGNSFSPLKHRLTRFSDKVYKISKA